MIDDILLLKFYVLGWNESSENKQPKKINTPILQKAYNLGYYNYIAGDDVKSIDLQTDEEIVKKIKE